MVFYAWRAGSAEGVTSDDGRARDRAAEFLPKNAGQVAVVETVHYDDWFRSMSHGYVKRGGPRWEGRRQGGRVVWRGSWAPAPKPAPLEPVAS